MKGELAAVERATFRAWPAREEVTWGPWVLRAHGGYTGRANSANLLDGDALVGEPATRWLEPLAAFFRERALPPRVRLPSFVQPQVADRALAAAGFARFAPTLVLWRALDRAAAVQPPPATLDLEAWLRLYEACRNVPLERRALHGDLLARITVSVCLAGVWEDDRPVACGVAVADGDYCGLFDIATHPDFRRQGRGGALVKKLLHWGAGQGARRAYLQVEMGNHPARRLYRRLGFQAAYYYWYRMLAD